MKQEMDNIDIDIATADGKPLDLDLLLHMTHISGMPLPGDEIRHVQTQRVFVVTKRVWSLNPSGKTLLTLVIAEPGVS